MEHPLLSPEQHTAIISTTLAECLADPQLMPFIDQLAAEQRLDIYTHARAVLSMDHPTLLAEAQRLDASTIPVEQIAREYDVYEVGNLISDYQDKVAGQDERARAREDATTHLRTRVAARLYGNSFIGQWGLNDMGPGPTLSSIKAYAAGCSATGILTTLAAAKIFEAETMAATQRDVAVINDLGRAIQALSTAALATDVHALDPQEVRLQCDLFALAEHLSVVVANFASRHQQSLSGHK